MTELLIYAVLFIALFAHAMMASMMYLAVHKNEYLESKEKNSWKLKALVFPAFYWFQYKKSIRP
ncbi:hypothetical protein [Pararhodonellum marinum]|uniref:hypothetical protein n=1 Tax=Pararhodonellum marinum TaxID=2755358 RepID=UPI0018907D0F|nr:hypothetical protein [Pararhodonellum marinum]